MAIRYWQFYPVLDCMLWNGNDGLIALSYKFIQYIGRGGSTVDQRCVSPRNQCPKINGLLYCIKYALKTGEKKPFIVAFFSILKIKAPTPAS